MDYLPHIICGLLAPLAAWFSIRRLTRARLIEDTPTSKIRSAPQGYVELMGHISREDNTPPLLSRLSNTPCQWFRYRIERYERRGKNSSWRTLESKSSERAFILSDGTGQCYVQPQRADISSHRKRVWHGHSRYRGTDDGGLLSGLLGSRYRYTEELLCDNDLIYALGYFQTRHPPSDSELNQQRMADILNEWKQDYDGLIARFDRDGDGNIDLQEWELARREALRKAERERRNQPPADAINMLSYSPSRQQPFIIATSEPESLSRRYRWQSLGLLILSLACAAGLAWLLLQERTIAPLTY